MADFPAEAEESERAVGRRLDPMLAAITAAFWVNVDEQGGTDPPFSVEQAWDDAVAAQARPAMLEEARRTAIAAAVMLGLSIEQIPDAAVQQLADAHVAGLAAYGDLLGSTAFTRAADGGDIVAEMERLLARDRLEILAERTAQGMANGLTDMVTSLPTSATGAVRTPSGKEWRTMLDDKVRPAHAELEGAVVEVGAMFLVDGYPAVAPGDPSLPPGLRVNCRCFCVPSGFEAAEWTAGLTDISGEVACDESGCSLDGGSILGDVPDTFAARRFVMAGDAHEHGVMVCLRLADPEALLVDGGAPVGQLHCTLAYLGKTDGVEQGPILPVVDALGQRGPFEAEVSTVTTFDANPDRPLVALVDAPGLAEFRTDLVRSLADAGIEQRSEHGFLAHVTLGYDATPEEEAAARERLAGVPIRFDTLELTYGVEASVYPLVEEDSMRATRFAMTEPGTLVRVPDGDYGQVTEVHTEGTHRTREETDIEASEAEPVAMVRLWEREDDEWVPTDQEWAYRVSDLQEVDELPDDEGDEDEVEDVEGDVPGEMPDAMGKNRVQPRLSAQANAARAAAGEFEWEMISCPLDTWSGDGRMIASDGIAWRDLPLSLMCMFRNPDAGGQGHDAAVVAGSTWEMEVDGDQVVSRGFFDSGEWGADLARMVSEGTMRGVSIDIGLADWEEVVDGDTGQCGYIFTRAEIMAQTACPMPAFSEASMWLVEGDAVTPTDMDKVSDAARAIAASGGPRQPILVRMTFGATWNLSAEGIAAAGGDVEDEPDEEMAVIGDTDLPFADREHEWDGEGARQRVEAWATDGDAIDFDRFGRAFLWRADDADPETVGAYSLGFADVVDGELMAVPRGIFAVAGVLSGARGGADIATEGQERLRGRVSGLYARMAETFDDEAIVAPWDADEAVAASAGDVTVIGTVPVVPPRTWFARQDYTGEEPWAVDDDGRIHGHAIDFSTYYNGPSHRGRRQRAVRCALGFAKFYGRPGTKVDDGAVISTGTLVIHSEHAPLSFDGDRVRDFHAHTGYAVADVCVYEDEYGLQIQGALRPNVLPWQVRVLRGSQISPHWCPMDTGRGHYLSALVAVNTGAIPLTRRNAIAASALDYCDAIAASAGLPAGSYVPIPADEVRAGFVDGRPSGMVGASRRRSFEERLSVLEHAEAQRRAEQVMAAYSESRTARQLDARAEAALAALRETTA